MSKAIEINIGELCLALEKIATGDKSEKDRAKEIRADIHQKHHLNALNESAEVSKSYRSISPANQGKLIHGGQSFSNLFERELKAGNWQDIDEPEIRGQLNESDLLQAEFELNLGDFSTWSMYRRGDAEMRAGPSGVDHLAYSKVVLRYVPKSGKTRIALYRDIPVADIDALFPNIKPKMSSKDFSRIWAMAAINASLIIFNLLTDPALVVDLLAGKISALLDKPIVLAAVAATSLYALQIRRNYRNTERRYLAEVTSLRHDHLIANDDAAVKEIVQISHEQEACEELLAVEFLRKAGKEISLDDLDKRVEKFLAGIGYAADFEVEDGVDKAVKGGYAVMVTDDSVIAK